MACLFTAQGLGINTVMALDILGMLFVHYFLTITDGPQFKVNLSALALEEMVMHQFKRA